MTATTGKLHAKLAAVMAEAERIPKNGQYSGQGQFKYVLVGDAADAIRKALGERKVSMLPSSVEVIGESEHDTRSGGTMTTQTIRTTWTLTDGETGETATIQSLGTGADAGDKFSPKAQTNAMKYALLMGFLLSTGDDPEQHDTSDRQALASAGAETEELLGRVDVKGKAVASRDNDQYKGEWRETPDGGHAIGFRLSRNGDKDIPQVLVMGDIGTALYIADFGPRSATSTGGLTASFIGQTVHVKGRLYAIKQRGRTTYNRLVIGEADGHFIETDEWTIPAPHAPEPPADSEVRPEAPTVPLFDEDADLDAVADKALA